jgi:hypothetical protein
VEAIAKSIGGEPALGTFQMNQDYPGAAINTKGQSFNTVWSKLTSSGFEAYPNFEHPGYSLRTTKPLQSGLWYHVVVAEPTEKHWVYGGHEAASRVADLSKPPASVTIHCHGTDPYGWEHIADTADKKFWWLWLVP